MMVGYSPHSYLYCRRTILHWSSTSLAHILHSLHHCSQHLYQLICASSHHNCNGCHINLMACQAVHSASVDPAAPTCEVSHTSHSTSPREKFLAPTHWFLDDVRVVFISSQSAWSSPSLVSIIFNSQDQRNWSRWKRIYQHQDLIYILTPSHL